MTDYTNVDFPYEEIRHEDGNYFCSQQELLDRGYKMSQIWSVLDGDGDEEKGVDYTITYAPGHHYVNNVGYFATEEHHDENTYYHEEITLDKN